MPISSPSPPTLGWPIQMGFSTRLQVAFGFVQPGNARGQCIWHCWFGLFGYSQSCRGMLWLGCSEWGVGQSAGPGADPVLVSTSSPDELQVHACTSRCDSAAIHTYLGLAKQAQSTIMVCWYHGWLFAVFTLVARLRMILRSLEVHKALQNQREATKPHL